MPMVPEAAVAMLACATWRGTFDDFQLLAGSVAGCNISSTGDRASDEGGRAGRSIP